MNKETLRQQFDRCYDENGWFVAVRNAVEGITAEQAAWRPDGADNSIWETLAHLNYYNNAYLVRFRDEDYEYKVASNDDTFAGSTEVSEDDWQDEIAKFDSVMDEWRGLLAAADESKFASPVRNKEDRNWGELLADINAHNAYHGGQILLLRKLQGSWNSEDGVS
ncbi:MAG: DinB family protein [Acidobacteria bacterium]|nr:DinB family protein [Acidobacteriota bacterium]